MKVSVKDYKILRTKEYFKASNLFFFVNGVNKSSLDWLPAKQGLKTIGFSYYKLLNRTTVKTLSNSIYSNIKPVISGSTFFIRPQTEKNFSKQTITNTFDPLLFELLMVKLNNRVYSLTSLKNAYSLNYNETKLLFYQLNTTHLKACSKISK
jgi:hypothetical protein